MVQQRTLARWSTYKLPATVRSTLHPGQKRRKLEVLQQEGQNAHRGHTDWLVDLTHAA